MAADPQGPGWGGFKPIMEGFAIGMQAGIFDYQDARANLRRLFGLDLRELPSELPGLPEFVVPDGEPSWDPDELADSDYQMGGTSDDE